MDLSRYYSKQRGYSEGSAYTGAGHGCVVRAAKLVVGEVDVLYRTVVCYVIVLIRLVVVATIVSLSGLRVCCCTCLEVVDLLGQRGDCGSSVVLCCDQLFFFTSHSELTNICNISHTNFKFNPARTPSQPHQQLQPESECTTPCLTIQNGGSNTG